MIAHPFQAVAVITPVAVRFSTSAEQATFETYLPKINSRLLLSSVDPQAFGFPKDNYFWAIIHKKSIRFPTSDQIKKAIKLALGKANG